VDACERYRRQIRESRTVLVESIATLDHTARTAGEEVSRKPEMLLASARSLGALGRRRSRHERHQHRYVTATEARAESIPHLLAPRALPPFVELPLRSCSRGLA